MKKFKASLDEYPETLSGELVFEYAHDSYVEEIEKLNLKLHDNSVNLTDDEVKKIKKELHEVHENLKFVDGMLLTYHIYTDTKEEEVKKENE